MKSILTKIYVLSLLCALPALANDVGLHNGSAQPTRANYILKECQETDSTGDPRSAMRGVDPAGMLFIYYQRHNRDVDLASIKTTLLEGTKHGKITAEADTTGLVAYRYDTEPGFVGKDRAVFMAELDDKTYWVVINLIVSTVVDENSPLCPAPQLIKVSQRRLG